MHRRRKFKKAGAPSTSTLSLLGKELREAHLQALLGGGSRVGSVNSNSADPLLSLVYSLPISEAGEPSSKPSAVDDNATAKGTPLQSKPRFVLRFLHQGHLFVREKAVIEL